MGIFDRFKKNNDISESLSLKIKSQDLVKEYQFEEAISCLEHALKIDESTETENQDEIKSMFWLSKGKIWREWGQYFANQEKFREGMDCYSKAFECYDRSKRYSRSYDDF